MRLADAEFRTTRGTVPLLAALLLSLAAAGPAQAQSAAPDRTVTVTPSKSPVEWEGAQATGANTQYDAGEPCGKTPADYCDVTLVHVDVPADYWETTAGGGVEFALGDFSPNPSSDFDMYVYESDARGRRGKLVGSSTGIPGAEERTTITKAEGHYRVQVVYYAVTQSGYTGSLRFVKRHRFPPDIDAPPGLQEFMASDPALGFRSQSEPHIAQSPLDPNILVAGSKRYNRDRDSLDEYEFKIGTYVSFDGGVIWRDLGQLAVCSPAESKQETYPNHDCYPAEDPDMGGDAEEDVDDPDDPEDPFDARGTDDWAEEYITSDVWIQFDDEGNAYVMVLDHPRFASHTENGWGMTLHRWESVSPADLEPGGKTWSKRLPINTYDNEGTQELFLDDKNTFAVNNAGKDRDGETGIMVSCWGQNIEPLLKQQTVCERSTDGGRTWPDTPVPISDVQQLVIGVHVVADTQDENTFYATWVQYASTLAGAPAELSFAKSTDGGRTWTRDPAPVALFQDIPRTFPEQSFRNLSIPIMAVGPDSELYITYAEYLDAPEPETDLDEMQSDIMMVKSTDGGSSWSEPSVINQDKSNADQFQQYIVVDPYGHLEVIYFDRRHDARVATGGDVTHPGNYFVDTYRARSEDGGTTWKEKRLSHDLSDPELNAPVSPSGLFYGDYQGLVADACYTIPFVQDSHRANPQGRDADFDAGMPRSDFQEVFAWRIPNETGFSSGRCAAPGAGVPPPLTRSGKPRLNLVAPRLASGVSTNRRFRVRMLSQSPNLSHYQLQARTGKRRFRPVGGKLLANSFRFSGRYGRTHRFRARAVTRDGVVGPWDYARTTVPLDDYRRSSRLRYRRSWKRVAERRAFRRAFHRAKRRGAAVRYRFRGGTRVYIVGRRSPRGGLARLIVDGKRKRVSFYGRRVRNRQVIATVKLSGGATRRHDLRFIALDRRSKKSRGKAAELDAVAIANFAGRR